MANVIRQIVKTRKKARNKMDNEKELVEEMMKNVPLMRTPEEQKEADQLYLDKLKRRETQKQKYQSGKQNNIKIQNDNEKKMKEEQIAANKLFLSRKDVKTVNSNRVSEKQRRILEDMEKNSPYNKRMEHERAKWHKSGCTEETCPVPSSNFVNHQEVHQSELPAWNLNQPGPMPGMRPTMGGAGGIVPPPQGKGSGAMGIIMPLYTVGIVVFFVYTIMKHYTAVLFKKGSDDEKAPKLKDFGMDPEYRKYVFAEEYLDNQNISTKSEFRRQQREDSRQRKKMHEVPDTKIDQHLRPTQMDTGGKKLGEWYLPEGFLNKEDNEDDEYLDNHGGTSYNEAMTETVGERLSRFKEEVHRENSEGNLYIPKGYINDDDIEDEEIQDILKDLQQITGGLTIDEAMSESKPDGMRSRSRKGKQKKSESSLEHFTDSDINAKNLLSFLRKGLDQSDIEHTEWKRLTDLCELAESVVDKRISDNIIDELEEPYEEEVENDYLNGIDTEEENMDGSYREDFFNDLEQKDHYQTSQNEYNIRKDKKQKENDQCQLKRIRNKDEMLSFKENFKPEEKLKHHHEISPSFFKEDESLPTIENVDDQDICISKDLQQIRQNNKSVAEDSNWKQECDKKDEQMDHLRRRLEDTETAMERLMNQMGSVTDKLTAAKITEVLSQAQAQAKILKDEAADLSFASEDDLTTSEALTTTMSDEPSFPSALHRHLQDLQNEEKTSSKDSSPDMEEYEVITKEGVEKKSCKKQSKESSPISTTETEELKKETENKSSEPASTTITPTIDKQDDMMTTTSQKEEEDSLDTADKTDESLSQISPATVDTTEKVDTVEKVDITEKVDTTEKVESDTSDTLSTVESKKEMPISEKLTSDDLSSTKPVIGEEENSIGGKVEE